MFQVYKLKESDWPTDWVKHHQNTNGRTFESLHELLQSCIQSVNHLPM